MANTQNLTDANLRADYREYQLTRSLSYTPWVTITFLAISAGFVLSDQFLRRMPVLSYVRVIPCLLASVLLISWYRKAPVRWLIVMQQTWVISYICMFYAFALITYRTELYKSSLVALMIGIFSVIVLGVFELRTLVLLYTLPLVAFIGLVNWLGLADSQLLELGNAIALMILCLVLYTIRERYAFSEFKLTRQLEQVLAQMKVTQAQLIQQEKMASLGEVTAGIAHELQNPLNFVINFGELSVELFNRLRQSANLDQEPAGQLQAKLLADNLQKIVQHSQRADRVIKGMLAHSRSDIGERRLINVNTLALEYLQLAHHSFHTKHGHIDVLMKTQLTPSPGLLEVVPQEIGRVLLNLYMNAFYAVMQKKEQSDKTFQPEVGVTTRRDDRQFVLAVRDNGVGMSPTVMEKVFQPFFTTKPVGEGTGLGLSISYDIITKGNNGMLTVASAENEFTEFTITLPV